ncbi:MAG: SDR family oxidoreductase, partial [Acidobacteriota bacterium]
LESAAREIGDKFGARVLARKADVRSEEDVQALVDEALDRFGRIDILVANAGGPPSSRFGDTAPSAWREGLELNLMSTVFLSRAVVPVMRRQKWGRIVAITSIAVKQPIEGLILSNVSRLGVLGLMKSMSAELAPEGILVNVVCPGYTRTGRLVELAERTAEREELTKEAIYQRWTAAIPMGRLGEPEEFASLVAFLVSEKASYITGTCIQVDGGYVRGVL